MAKMACLLFYSPEKQHLKKLKLCKLSALETPVTETVDISPSVWRKQKRRANSLWETQEKRRGKKTQSVWHSQIEMQNTFEAQNTSRWVKLSLNCDDISLRSVEEIKYRWIIRGSHLMRCFFSSKWNNKAPNAINFNLRVISIPPWRF